MDKASFSKSITEAIKPSTSNIDLNRTLYNFQHTVNAFFFTQFKVTDIPNLFKTIWKFLLTAANSQSATTRLASYRATGAFLTRVTPFYPALVHESFSEVALLVTIDFKSSAIIASSFAFISRYIANPFMKKFINSAPVFHHFCSDDPAFSEHLPTIISNLKHLGTDWMKNLLQFFLEKIDESSLASRYLIKAVSAIVGHNPKFYIQQILDWMDDNTVKTDDTETSLPIIQKKYIALFVFFISGHQKEIEDCVDLYPIAHSAALLLSQSTTENSSLSDLDAALQLLSTPSLSFRVQVTFDQENSNMCKITVIKTNKVSSSACVVDEENQRIEVDLNTDNFSKRPSFYMIHLPLDNLRPKEDDSLLILGAKFKSLSTYYTGLRVRNNDNDDRTLEVFEIYQPYLKSDYNEQRSAAIQGLSICINRFIQIVPIDQLLVSLRRILFTDTVSWYHSTDILRVIKKVDDYTDLANKLGVNFFIELLNCLIGFCFSENESLSKESMETLKNISSIQNVNIIIKIIYTKTDFLDPLNLKRSCTMMAFVINKIKKLINEVHNLSYDDTFIDNYTDETKIGLYDALFKSIPELELFTSQLIEAVPLYYDNLLLLTHIHHFCSVYKVTPSYQFRSVLSTALCIAISTVEVISGQDVISTGKFEDALNQSKPFIPGSIINEQSSNSDDEDNPMVLFYRHFRRIVEQDIRNKNVDIITESFSDDDDKSFILPLKNALLCIFVYANEEDALNFSILTYQLFPLENSKFFNMIWQTVSPENKSKILKNMPNFLKYENDEHIHIEWCSMCLQQLDVVTTDGDYLILVDILADTALNFFQRTNETNGNLAAVYCKFLIGIHYGNANTVIEKYLTQLMENEDNSHNLIQIVEGFPEVISLFPQLFANKNYEKNSHPRTINDSKLTEEIKMTFDVSNEDLNDPNKIQGIFEKVVRINQIWLLKQIIKIADSLNVVLDPKIDSDQTTDSLEYSELSIPIIAQYMADHNIKLNKSALVRLQSTSLQNQRGSSDLLIDLEKGDFNEEELILCNALRHVRSIWGPYYISIIKENPNLLLESFLKKEKVKKNDILAFSYLINTNLVDFDMTLLFKLASKLIIATSSQSTPLSNSIIRQLSISRYRIIMYFISVVISKIVSQYRIKKIESIGSVIPIDFPNQLVKEITPDFERLPVDIVTYLFLLLAQNIALSEEVIQFVKRLFTLCSSDSTSNSQSSNNEFDPSNDVSTVLNRSTPYGYIHQILIGLSSNTRYVGKNYISGLPDIILPCLHSKMPSICMIGMRLLEQALLSIPTQFIIPCVHVGFEQIMKKLHYIYIHLPPCVEKVYHTIMSLLTKKDALQLQITFVQSIPDKTTISPHSGGFSASVAYLPAVVAIISPKQFSNYLSVYHYSCETLFNFPASFTSALRSLIEHARRFNEDDQETIMMNSFINWLNLINPDQSSEMKNPRATTKPNVQITKTKSAGFLFKKKNKTDTSNTPSRKGGKIKGFISNFMKKDKEVKIELIQEDINDQPSNETQNDNISLEKNLSFGDSHLNMLNKEDEKYLGYAFITPEKIKKQVGQWIDAFCLLMAPSKAFSILGFQLLKKMEFKMVYPSLLKFFINNRDDEEFNECIDGILELPQHECHRVALKLWKTCDKYKEMIQLSAFDCDCLESQKLVNELRDFMPKTL